MKVKMMCCSVVMWLLGYWTCMVVLSSDDGKEDTYDVEKYLVRHWVLLSTVQVLIMLVMLLFLLYLIYRLWQPGVRRPIPRGDDDPEDAEDARTRAQRIERELRIALRQEGTCCGRLRLRAELLYRVNKRVYDSFKHQPLGVLLLERWLKLQDVASDIIVTVHLWQHVKKDWWWAHVSLFLLLNTPILLWIITAPIFHKRMTKERSLPQGLSILLWVVFGLPTVVVLDLFMLVKYPCREPKAGWLSNVFKLQKFAEATVEAPLQLILQIWIFIETTFIEERQIFAVPYMLLFSVLTSLFTFATTFYEIKELAAVQEMSFFECLVDFLLVGLDRRAPLLHILRSRAAVTYEGEGPLSRAQCEQIASVAASAANLTRLTFTAENDLDMDSFSVLFARMPRALEVTAEDVRYSGSRQRLLLGREGGPAVSRQVAERVARGAQNLPNLKIRLLLQRIEDVGHDDWEVLLTLQHLRTVELGSKEGPKFTLRALPALPMLPHLHALRLRRGVNLTIDTLLVLVGAAPRALEVSGGDFKYISSNGTLEVARDLHFGADGCRRLKDLQQLTSLTIGDYNNIDAEGCKHLKELQQLTSLTVGGGNGIGAEGCKHLKDLQQLTSLTIGRENDIGAEGCKHLKDLQQLTSLRIGRENDIGAEGCKHLKDLQQLTSLTIGGGHDIGAEGCKHLKDLQQLTSLTIGEWNDIGVEGRNYLKELPRLEELIIHRSNGAEASGLRHILQSARGLRSLPSGDSNSSSAF